MSKIPFIIGLGAGYVLGTRAGRERYEQLRAAASHVADKPFVRERVSRAQEAAGEFVRQQGEALTDKVTDAVKERLFAPRPQAQPADSASAGEADNSADPVTVPDAEVRPPS